MEDGIITQGALVALYNYMSQILVELIKMANLIVVCGPQAVGKMTVGQELMKLTGLRLFHNHMTIEPVLDIFGYFSIFCSILY